MKSHGELTILRKPKLRHPVLVCSIGGWVDAGEAATGSTQYLVKKLKARRFAEIPIARFHVFQTPGQLSLRPQIRIEDGILKEHHFPQNQFFCSSVPGADSDLILFLGTEPNLNWEEYADAILNLAEQLTVSRIYLLGGVLDTTPHTREPCVSCLCSSEELKEEMRPYGMPFANYEGPGRFGTTLLHICQTRKIPMVCLTASATYYPEFNIVIARNPKSIRAVVRRLSKLLGLSLDISDLAREVERFEAKLGLIVRRNSRLRAYVEKLERDFEEANYEEPLDMSASEAVRLAERFLKAEDQD